MISSLYRTIPVSRIVIRCFASKSRSGKKKLPKDLAFPDKFEKKLKLWPELIQCEINEIASDSGSGRRSNNISLLELDFHDYFIDSSGHVGEFHYKDPSSGKQFSRSAPVRLIEEGDRIRRYECIVLKKVPKGLLLKFRGNHGDCFDPVLASDYKYSVLPSEDFGTLQVLKQFLDERHKWKDMPGYNIMQHVYRAKQMKTFYVDRPLKYYQVGFFL